MATYGWPRTAIPSLQQARAPYPLAVVRRGTHPLCCQGDYVVMEAVDFVIRTLAQVQNQHHYPIAPWFRTLFVASQSLLGPETGWNQHDTASEASFGASKRCSWVT